MANDEIDLTQYSSDEDVEDYLTLAEEELTFQITGNSATFLPIDENQLGAVWTNTMSDLNARGYFKDTPALDTHFRAVFMLLVKEWQGCLHQVRFLDQGDADFIVCSSDVESSDYEADTEEYDSC